MISAFGVEHTISKSYVGGVFKPATKLASKERKVVQAGGAYRRAKGVTPSDREFANQHQNVIDGHKALKDDWSVGHKKTIPGKNGKTEVYQHTMLSRHMPAGVHGFHVREGGKQGTSHVHISGSFGTKKKKTLTHELAHASPKRSSYRMHQIFHDPAKTMKEEARADFTAQGHYKKGTGQSGYAQAAARRSQALKQGKKNKKVTGRLRKIPVIGRSLSNKASLPGTRYTKQSIQQSRKHLTATMGRPIKNKDVDGYIKVQNKMRSARKR